MTIKEAILKSLDGINVPKNYMEVHDHIKKKGYYDFGSAKTPASTVSALLGDFIRNGDTRVKRIKQQGGTYFYYLTKNEQNIPIDVLSGETEVKSTIPTNISKTKTYEERDLHKLLSSYLKNTDTYSKTIFHEQSNNKDTNQIWTHPDMVGVKFLNLQNNVSQNFLKSINRVDTFKLSSYEIKKEINSDSELKKAYFQAVSNSSWANYGYLVAFEFSNDNLSNEMERLNQSFGIGIIELNAYPYQSKILFQSTYRDLDFKTIDKLCMINDEFKQFIEKTDRLMMAQESYYKSTKRELDDFCDRYFENDTNIKEYCEEKNIPNEFEPYKQKNLK